MPYADKTKDRLFHIHWNAKQRCYNENAINYKNYGARSIKLCDEWANNFHKFYSWAINNGYQNDLTLDRINVDGDYEPGNCRWVDMKTQCRNKTNNKNYTINSETHCLSEWCEIFGVSTHAVSQRLKYGYTIKQALCTPLYHSQSIIEHDNESHSLYAWCKILGLKYITVYQRIRRGWPIEKALNNFYISDDM